jgi:hypothetical protein
MSIGNAKAFAMRAQSTNDTNEKLDLIAKAIYELARSIDDVERKVNHLK